MLDSVAAALERMEKATKEAEGLTIPPNASPLDFLCAIFRDPRQPMGRRMRAAEAAAVFVHPKLAVTAAINGDQFGARLERALKRSGKVIDHSPPMIEHRQSVERS